MRYMEIKYCVSCGEVSTIPKELRLEAQHLFHFNKTWTSILETIKQYYLYYRNCFTGERA